MQVWPQNWEWYNPWEEETMDWAINRSIMYIRCNQSDQESLNELFDKAFELVAESMQQSPPN